MKNNCFLQLTSFFLTFFVCISCNNHSNNVVSNGEPSEINNTKTINNSIYQNANNHSYTDKILITTDDDFQYYELRQERKGDTLRGVEDLDGNLIVPVKMREISYRRCYRSKGDFDLNDYRVFLCTIGDESGFMEAYKVDGTCVIDQSRKYTRIWAYGGTSSSFQLLYYRVWTEDDLNGMCDANGKVIIRPKKWNTYEFHATVIRTCEIKSRQWGYEISQKYDDFGNSDYSNVVFQYDYCSVYGADGECIIAPDEYLSVGVISFAHFSNDDNRYYFICRRKDLGTDIRGPKGKLICSCSGSAAMVYGVTPETATPYFYFVCSSASDLTKYGRYKETSDYYFQGTTSYYSEATQEVEIYDLFGNFVYSVNGKWNLLCDDEDEACNGVTVGYDGRKGFYKTYAKKVREYGHTDWDWGDPVYINKWLDNDYRVTAQRSGQQGGSTPSPEPSRQLQPFQKWVDCPNCMGGNCPTCDGQGWRWVSFTHPHEQCITCGGSGKCTMCSGQGGHYEIEYR